MKIPRILILGASFDTGNLGVSALGESTIKCIIHYWSHAKVKLLGASREESIHTLTIGKQTLDIPNIPVHFSKKIFLSNHFFVLFFYSILFRIFCFRRFKDFFIRRNIYLEELCNTDFIVDITGGDSFSDIYGMKRFILGFLRKMLPIIYKKPLIFLPQTYGPFNKRITRFMASYILNKATLILSRDREGIETLEKILPNDFFRKNVKLIPDVAFILDKRKPNNWNSNKISKQGIKKPVIVGLNVSGLLFNGGYTGNNMFNLVINYPDLIYSIIDFFMKKPQVIVFLIPHVFPPDEFKVESDPDACKQVYNKTRTRYKNRLFNMEGSYDQNEIKYIIGLVNIFIGARMHSCIAAMSQCIPTVGMAYSGKFRGVFRSANVDEYVADMRGEDKDSIISLIAECFNKRKRIANHLKNTIPKLKREVLSVFDGLRI